MEAVPTGITSDRGQLLVSLFTGFPFAPGVSSIQQVDLVTGVATPLITGRKNAIGVLPIKRRGETSHLVLQYASVGPFFASPGQVLHFTSPTAAPTLIAELPDTPHLDGVKREDERAVRHRVWRAAPLYPDGAVAAAQHHPGRQLRARGATRLPRCLDCG
ncbi:hypothetical protein BH20VER2_BH20VER2_19150 [soil metagenome]